RRARVAGSDVARAVRQRIGDAFAGRVAGPRGWGASTEGRRRRVARRRSIGGSLSAIGGRRRGGVGWRRWIGRPRGGITRRRRIGGGGRGGGIAGRRRQLGRWRIGLRHHGHG